MRAVWRVGAVALVWALALYLPMLVVGLVDRVVEVPQWLLLATIVWLVALPAHIVAVRPWLFRRVVLPVEARSRGWEYAVKPPSLTSRVGDVICTVSGTYRGHRFEAVQRLVPSTRDEGTTTESRVTVTGLGELPRAFVDYRRFRGVVEVSGTAAHPAFVTWLTRRLFTGTSFSTGPDTASAKLKFLTGGRLRRRVRFLAAAAEHLSAHVRSH